MTSKDSVCQQCREQAANIAAKTSACCAFGDLKSTLEDLAATNRESMNTSIQHTVDLEHKKVQLENTLLECEDQKKTINELQLRIGLLETQLEELRKTFKMREVEVAAEEAVQAVNAMDVSSDPEPRVTTSNPCILFYGDKSVRKLKLGKAKSIPNLQDAIYSVASLPGQR